MIKANSIVGIILISLLGIIFLPFILVILSFWAIYQLIKCYDKKKNIFYLESIDNMSPYEFEKYIARLFISIGYKAVTTSASRDYGIDVIAKNNDEIIAIQVKKYKKCSVGNVEVQRLLGAMQMKGVRADRSILITTSRFTKNAIKQAEGCPIELWDGKKLGRIIRQCLKKEEE